MNKKNDATRDLGWANDWRETPLIVLRCRRLGHKPSDVDIGPPMRGIQHVVRCDICEYRYAYDSSD